MAELTTRSGPEVSPPLHDRTSETVDRIIDAAVIPALSEYIALPALSPAFDPSWATTGAIDEAMAAFVAYARRRPIASLHVEIDRIEGRTPVLFCEIAPTEPSSPTTLIYGHLDKQPALGQWREGLGPFTPVIEDSRLYGRGAADDGYAFFAALAAVEAVQATGGSHGRIVIVIEASEESGSPDLDVHLDRLGEQIGQPDIVVCLDSGCVTYDRLWITTSLRGIVTGSLRVAVAREGVHSGHAGGIVPSPWRIARALIDRLEDRESGDITLPALRSEIPAHRRHEIDAVAEDLGEDGAGVFPFLSGVVPEGSGPADRIARGTWHAALAVIGVDGIPAIADAGNVALPNLDIKLAIRLPPDIDADVAARALEAALTDDPPSGAHVEFDVEQVASGWDAPALDPVITATLEQSSVARFGRGPSSIGLGGSIPFLGTLGARYPNAQLLATGVLGPESNAHGPNEFLHLPTLRALTCTLADLLSASR